VPDVLTVVKEPGFKISKYHGHSHEDLELWANRCRDIASEYGWSDSSLYGKARLSLQGDAARVFNNHRKFLEEKQSFDGLLQVLRDRFGSVNEKKDAYENFLAIRQADGESCAAFISRFRTALTTLQRFASVEDPGMTLHIFRKAVHRRYQFMLHMDKPHTLSEAISSLRNAEYAPGVEPHSADINLIHSSSVSSGTTAHVLDQLTESLKQVAVRQTAMQARLDSFRDSSPPLLSSGLAMSNEHTQYRQPGQTQFSAPVFTRAKFRRRPRCTYCGRTHRQPCSIQAAHQRGDNFFSSFCTECNQPGHTFRFCAKT